MAKRFFIAGLLLITGNLMAAEGTKDPCSVLKTGPGIETIVVLPDTQFDVQPGTYFNFMNQTHWIVKNKDLYNIKYVILVGDIQNDNSDEQWKAAREAMAVLDGQVPYAVTGGNHDYGTKGSGDTRQTLMSDYFRTEEFKASPCYGGLYETNSIENSYHLFSLGNQKIMILNLEWGPRDAVVAWANQVVSQHPECRVILNTHAYLYYDNTRYDWAKYGDTQIWSPKWAKHYKLAENVEAAGGINDGEDLWQKLVSRYPNFFLTLNGHVLVDGLARLESKGAGGSTVNQVLVNYQWPMYDKKGGQGYLRIMQFLPDGKTIFNASYSPSLDEYRTDDQNQFVLTNSPALGIRLMETYLKDAGTVTPQPNPAFDPAQYRPEAIGAQKGGLKVAGAAKAGTPASSAAVGGWLASGSTCTLETAAGALVVNSTGGDPYFSVQKLTAVPGGPFTIRLRMKSDSSGAALVYYNKPFGKDHTVGFPVEHDGQWHEYEAAIPAPNLDALRLDPSTAPGRIEIDWIRIEKDAGTVVQEWTF
ncbi:MAG: metallophosphoesterase [Kiritimatiellales bacterium]